MVDTHKGEWRGIKQQAEAKAFNADIRTDYGTFFCWPTAVMDFTDSSRDGQPVSRLHLTEI
jgi:hypothetical protein